MRDLDGLLDLLEDGEWLVVTVVDDEGLERQSLDILEGTILNESLLLISCDIRGVELDDWGSVINLYLLGLGRIDRDVIHGINESQTHIISNRDLAREWFFSPLVQLLDSKSNNCLALACGKNYLE